jgi:hypothetical protein
MLYRKRTIDELKCLRMKHILIKTKGKQQVEQWFVEFSKMLLNFEILCLHVFSIHRNFVW